MINLYLILIVFISYMIGNISPAIIIGKWKAGIDIREHGSGNAGTTNVLRTMGKKAAVVTLLVDAMKGAVCIFIGNAYGGLDAAMLCGLAVICGHIWPVCFKFKGGKGVATVIGAALALDLKVAFICIVVGLLIIIITKRVSPAALIGILLFPISAYFMQPETNLYIWGIIITIIVWYKHKANIIRILKGEEPKISLKNNRGGKNE